MKKIFLLLLSFLAIDSLHAQEDVPGGEAVDLDAVVGITRDHVPRTGGRPTGAAEDDLRDAVQLHSCQTVTPETATSSHYFFQQSHRGSAANPEVVQIIFDALVAAFEEDRAMITAQAGILALSPDAPMLPLHFDAALTRFRSQVAQAVAAEAARADPIGNEPPR